MACGSGIFESIRKVWFVTNSEQKRFLVCKGAKMSKEYTDSVVFSTQQTTLLWCLCLVYGLLCLTHFWTMGTALNDWSFVQVLSYENAQRSESFLIQFHLCKRKSSFSVLFQGSWHWGRLKRNFRDLGNIERLPLSPFFIPTDELVQHGCLSMVLGI